MDWRGNAKHRDDWSSERGELWFPNPETWRDLHHPLSLPHSVGGVWQTGRDTCDRRCLSPQTSLASLLRLNQYGRTFPAHRTLRIGRGKWEGKLSTEGQPRLCILTNYSLCLRTQSYQAERKGEGRVMGWRKSSDLWIHIAFWIWRGLNFTESGNPDSLSRKCELSHMFVEARE